mmetsp:Transcript_118733/g.383394  ORF Transcript_118733/g.383394 Transcript_118733/m.383394 type:complete len:320 (-) Transcript_118733:971-1930(-)
MTEAPLPTAGAAPAFQPWAAFSPASWSGASCRAATSSSGGCAGGVDPSLPSTLRSCSWAPMSSSSQAANAARQRRWQSGGISGPASPVQPLLPGIMRRPVVLPQLAPAFPAPGPGSESELPDSEPRASDASASASQARKAPRAASTAQASTASSRPTIATRTVKATSLQLGPGTALLGADCASAPTSSSCNKASNCLSTSRGWPSNTASRFRGTQSCALRRTAAAVCSLKSVAARKVTALGTEAAGMHLSTSAAAAATSLVKPCEMGSPLSCDDPLRASARKMFTRAIAWRTAVQQLSGHMRALASAVMSRKAPGETRT